MLSRVFCMRERSVRIGNILRQAEGIFLNTSYFQMVHNQMKATNVWMNVHNNFVKVRKRWKFGPNKQEKRDLGPLLQPATRGRTRYFWELPSPHMSIVMAKCEAGLIILEYKSKEIHPSIRPGCTSLGANPRWHFTKVKSITGPAHGDRQPVTPEPVDNSESPNSSKSLVSKQEITRWKQIL